MFGMITPYLHRSLIKYKSIDMSDKPLYWDASYEIVLALMEKFPTVEIDSVGTQQLYQMIIELPNFADDPALVNDGILNDILREWYEEYTN